MIFSFCQSGRFGSAAVAGIQFLHRLGDICAGLVGVALDHGQGLVTAKAFGLTAPCDGCAYCVCIDLVLFLEAAGIGQS